jgi:hypothetical protein
MQRGPAHTKLLMSAHSGYAPLTRLVHPVSSVRGEEELDGNGLIRKRPSGLRPLRSLRMTGFDLFN